MEENCIKNKYKKLLLDIIYKHLSKCKVYLFGSRARKTHQEGSDIDLVLDNNKPIDLRIIAKIYMEIEESSIPLFVDLVDLQTASEEFKQEIKNEKILWEN